MFNKFLKIHQIDNVINQKKDIKMIKVLTKQVDDKN